MTNRRPHRALFAWFLGALGLALFPWGGFFLLPVALDLWESGQTDSTV